MEAAPLLHRCRCCYHGLAIARLRSPRGIRNDAGRWASSRTVFESVAPASVLEDRGLSEADTDS